MASPGAEELIGWHLNRGLDEAPEWYSAARFRDLFHRPDVVAVVLDELDVDKALARANREAGIAPAPAPALEEILSPVIQILEPASGTRIERDPVILRYLVWTPGGEPVPTVRVMVNGALAIRSRRPILPSRPRGGLEKSTSPSFVGRATAKRSSA